MATVQQVLDIARSQLGVKESPAGSNRQPYGAWFGLNAEPWCAIFVAWVFNRANVPLPIRTAGVYALRDAFKATGKLYSSPQPGDVVLYNFGSGHCGVVESVQGSNIVTIEGNTGIGSQDNGGMVMRRTRSATFDVFGYGRPDYSNSPPPVTPAPAQEVDDMSDALTITYPNGSKTVVGPDGSVFNAGTQFFGSMYDLPPAAKQGVQSIKAATAVNPNDSSAGYTLFAQNGNPYKFDAAQWHALGH